MSNPPFGCQRLGDWHIPNPKEAEAITFIRSLRNRGVSHPQIARRLNAEEIQSRGGAFWQVSTLHKILNRKPRNTVPDCQGGDSEHTDACQTQLEALPPQLALQHQQ